MNVLVAGIGSVLRGDDGVGARVIEALSGAALHGNIKLSAGDISGFDLASRLGDFAKAVIIDAADMNEAPGTVRVFTPSEIKLTSFKDNFSTHSMALAETLTLAEKIGISCEIVIIGVQPANTSYGMGLSAPLEGKIPFLVSKVKELIQDAV